MMYQSTTRVVSTARPAPNASQSTAMRTSARRATSERDAERKRFRSCSPVVVGGTSIRRDPSEVPGGGLQEPAEERCDLIRPEDMYRWEGPEPTREERRQHERALVREARRDREPRTTPIPRFRRLSPLPFAALLRVRVAAG